MADVNLEVALAVMSEAIDEGVAGIQVSKDDRREYISRRRWSPRYHPYEFNIA